jgi:hypothetical protein
MIVTVKLWPSTVLSSNPEYPDNNYGTNMV